MRDEEVVLDSIILQTSLYCVIVILKELCKGDADAGFDAKVDANEGTIWISLHSAGRSIQSEFFVGNLVSRAAVQQFLDGLTETMRYKVEYVAKALIRKL